MLRSHPPFMKIPTHSYRFIGKQPGPTTVIIGGTHGDELTGIEVVKKLLKKFGVKDLSQNEYETDAIFGELFLVFGNPEAIRLRQRGTTEGRDLNRYFIDEDLDREALPKDPYDLIRARELAPLLASADYLFDIHATSNESPPFVVCGKDSPKHRELFSLLPVEYVLMDRRNILAIDEGMQNRGTTDAYVEKHGGIAIGYETGKEDDLARVASVIDDLDRLLIFVGNLYSLKKTDFQPVPTQKIFTLSHSVQAKYDGFSYKEGMNQGWQNVTKGQIVGSYLNGEQETIPNDGMMIFPKSEQKIRKGKNMYYLAALIAEAVNVYQRPIS